MRFHIAKKNYQNFKKLFSQKGIFSNYILKISWFNKFFEVESSIKEVLFDPKFLVDLPLLPPPR